MGNPKVRREADCDQRALCGVISKAKTHRSGSAESYKPLKKLATGSDTERWDLGDELVAS
jgi:hypothetical protein